MDPYSFKLGREHLPFLGRNLMRRKSRAKNKYGSVETAFMDYVRSRSSETKFPVVINLCRSEDEVLALEDLEPKSEYTRSLVDDDDGSHIQAQKKEINEGTKAALSALLNRHISECLGVNSVFPRCQEGSFVKYEQGGFFEEHMDTYYPWVDDTVLDRRWTMVVILQKSHKGGATIFGHKSLKPDRGQAILWPNLWYMRDGILLTENDFMTHRAEQIIQGQKRIINAWFGDILRPIKHNPRGSRGVLHWGPTIGARNRDFLPTDDGTKIYRESLDSGHTYEDTASADHHAGYKMFEPRLGSVVSGDITKDDEPGDSGDTTEDDEPPSHKRVGPLIHKDVKRMRGT